MTKSSRYHFQPTDVDAVLATRGGLLTSSETGELDQERWIGARVGAYRITDLIARGGMSVVFRGERTDGQFEMPVAIKVLDSLASAERVARFEHEREILASLQHQGIARILDGGSYGGHPVLVMDLVSGMPIDAYCDHHRLSVSARMELLEKVCAAVEYAHARLVIHRDIKPPNILVTDAGEPRLLDFGIAKIVGDHDAELTVDRAPLTPRYASPEQLRGQAVHVASDIYQIGLLGYRLLTGRHVRDEDTARVASDETGTVSLDVPPLGLAWRRIVQSAPDEAIQLAARRTASVEQLTRELGGDPEAILAACTREAPERRYATVSDLLADLEAFRQHRPVSARSITPLYRMQRFVRRHRGGVTAAALSLLMLVGSLASVLWSYRGTLLAQQAAEREADRAQQVTTLLTDLLRGADPETSLGRDITVREMLDQAVRQIGGGLTGQSLTEADLRVVIADLYTRLGRYDEARDQLQIALRSYEQAGEEAAALGRARAKLAGLLTALGHYDDATDALERALSQQREVLGWDHPDTLNTRKAAVALQSVQGRRVEALSAAQEIVEQYAADQAQGTDYVEALHQLAQLQVHATRYDDARTTLEEAIAVQKRHTPGPSLLLAELHRDLGGIGTFLGDRDLSATHQALSVSMTQALVGSDHPLTAKALLERAGYYSQAGDFALAETDLLDAMSVIRAVAGETHDAMASAWNNLAVLRFRQERFGEAAADYSRAITIYQTLFGAEHPDSVSTELYRAYAWHLAGDPRAERAYRDLIPRLQNVRGPDHAHTSHVYADLGRLLVEGGRHQEALAYLDRALSIRRDIYGAESRMVVDTQLYRGAALSALGRLDAAGPLIRHAVEVRSNATMNREQLVHEANLYLARHLARLGESQAARELWQSTTRAITTTYPTTHWLNRGRTTQIPDFSS